MKKNTAAPLCEGAIVTALTTVLMVMGMYVPAFGMFTLFIGGIPLMWLTIKRGLYISAASLAASMLLMFAISGNFLSGPLTCFMTLLPSIAAGYCMRRSSGYYTALTAVSAAVALGYIIDIMIMNAMAGGDNAVIKMLDESVGTLKTMMSGYLSGIPESETIMQTLNEGLDAGKNAVISYFPALLIIASAVTGYAIFSACIFFARRLRAKNYEYVKFSMIKAPKSVCTVAVILMIISFLSSDSTIYTLALKNVVAVLAFLLVADGMSLVDFKLSAKVKSGYKRFLIYILAMMIGYMFLSLIIYALMFMGMFDANMDFRVLKRAGDDIEKQ